MPDAAPAAFGVYKPRRPQALPLFRLVSDHLHRLQTGQGCARRRGQAARHRLRATAGADRSRPSLGGSASAARRS